MSTNKTTYCVVNFDGGQISFDPYYDQQFRCWPNVDVPDKGKKEMIKHVFSKQSNAGNKIYYNLEDFCEHGTIYSEPMDRYSLYVKLSFDITFVRLLVSMDDLPPVRVILRIGNTVYNAIKLIECDYNVKGDFYLNGVKLNSYQKIDGQQFNINTINDVVFKPFVESNICGAIADIQQTTHRDEGILTAIAGAIAISTEEKNNK